MAITHIFFDIGGVLCRFDRGWRETALAEASGLTEREVHRLLYDTGFVRDADIGRYDAEAIAVELNRRLGLSLSHAEIRALWASAFRAEPDVLDVAARAQGRATRLLFSNNDALIQEAIPEVFGGPLERWVEGCLFSWTLGAEKTDPRCYAEALRRTGCRAADILLVDDNRRVNACAEEAGLIVFPFSGPGDAPALERRIAELTR